MYQKKFKQKSLIILSSLFMLSLICCGCSKKEEKHAVTFKKDVVVSYGSNVNTCKFVNKIDSDFVSNSMINDNEIYDGNTVMACPVVDFNEVDLGDITLDYTIGQQVYSLLISVVDDEAPVVVLSDEAVSMVEGDKSSIDYSKYFTVTDNYDDVEDIKIEIDDESVNLNKAGDYSVSVIATDTSGNECMVSLPVKITEKPKKQESQKEQTSGGGSSSASNNNGTNYYSPPVQDNSYTVPACSYASFYESTYGDLISAYNAAENYYSSCSGSASLNPINDGEGNTIGWSVG